MAETMTAADPAEEGEVLDAGTDKSKQARNSIAHRLSTLTHCATSVVSNITASCHSNSWSDSSTLRQIQMGSSYQGPRKVLWWKLDRAGSQDLENVCN